MSGSVLPRAVIASRADLETLLRADGFGHTLPSRTVLERPVREVRPTGLPDVDHAVGGGAPVGALTEIVGLPSSGRTGVVYAWLSAATSGEGWVAYVDAAEVFDPWSADRCGVALDRLLWVRCSGRGETAVRAAEVVAGSAGFQVVVLDVGGLPPSRLRRFPPAVFLRLRRAVAGTPTALVLLADHPVSGAHAALALRCERTPAAWSGKYPAGRLLQDVRRAPPVVVHRRRAQ
jgi:hypothetical protein